MDELYNPPERTQLSYRRGTYDAFVASMLQQLADQAAANGITLDRSGIVEGLLGAWAQVGDVLCFYQERIANEGYLNTGTEDFSVTSLVSSIGYRPAPALSATTALAFTVHTANGAPPTVLVPQGTAIQSLPSSGQLPVIFETAHDIEARVEWNALPVQKATVVTRSRIRTGTTQIRLAGARAELRPGYPLLIVGTRPGGSDTVSFVRIIERVDIDRARGATVVTWKEPLAGTGTGDLLESPSVFGFRQSAKIFGANAKPWSAIPESVRDKAVARPGGVLVQRADGPATSWSQLDNALLSDVVALAYDAEGALVALTPVSVLRYSGDTIETAGDAPARGLQSLHVSGDGRYYVGTKRGDVFGSSDRGATWYAVGSSKSAGPRIAVRDLITIVRDTREYVLAATDKGVVRVVDDGSDWVGQSDGLPGYNASTRLATISIFAIADDAVNRRTYLATDSGLYAGTGLAKWSLVPIAALPGKTPVRSVAFARAATSSRVIVGTDSGLFGSSDAGTTWERLGSSNGSIGGVIRCIRACGARVIAAGDRGIWISQDTGKTWTGVAAAGFESPTICAIASDTASAAAPLAAFGQTEWPGFALDATVVDLDRNYPSVVPNSWAVIVQYAPVPVHIALPVSDVSVVLCNAFLLSGVVSRLTVPAIANPERIDRRSATVFCASQAYPLYEQAVPAAVAVTGTTIVLDGAVDGLTSGQRLSLVGTRIGLHVLASQGVVRHFDGTTWIDKGDFGTDPLCMLVEPEEQLVIGTSAGVLVWESSGSRHIGLETQTVAALTRASTGTLFAGSQHGLFKHLGVSTWASIPDVTVSTQCLLTAPGAIYAGSSSGLFWSQDDGATWSGYGGLLAQADVRALLYDAHWGVIVATSAGVICIAANGTASAINDGLENLDAMSLALDATTSTLYCGTRGGGYFQRAALAQPWMLRSRGSITGDIRAIACDAGNVYVAERGLGVLRDGAPFSTGARNDVRAIVPVPKNGLYLLARTATVVTSYDGLKTMELSRTLLGTIDAALIQKLDSLSATDLIAPLQKLGVTLTPASVVRVARADAIWLIDDGAGNTFTLHFNLSSNLAVYREMLLQVSQTPVPVPGQSGLERYYLEDRNGNARTATLRASDVLWASAGTAAAPCSEIATIESATIGSDRRTTTIELSRPLANMFDASSLTICANVAYASHGESLTLYEALGSGDASVANQRFVLKKAPLSILPGDGELLTRQLTVRVRGNSPRDAVSAMGQLRMMPAEQNAVEWHEVPSLYQSGPHDRHYMTRELPPGQAQNLSTLDDVPTQTEIIFGDGVHGRRLPSGQENVLAMYRSGSGPSGNIDAGRLVLLRKRPAGLRSVTNPVPSTGGSPAEPSSTIKANAPRSVRVLGRVVTFTDYQAFAASYPGIACADAVMLAHEGRTHIHVTVLGLDEQPISSGSSLFTALTNALKAARASVQPFYLHTGTVSRFCIRARLSVDPDYERDVVFTSVTQALLDAYAFSNRSFGDDVVPSEIVAAMQNVDGVKAVFLEALYRVGETPGTVNRIIATATHWDARFKTVVPAEILVINDRSEDGIVLDVATA